MNDAIKTFFSESRDIYVSCIPESPSVRDAVWSLLDGGTVRAGGSLRSLCCRIGYSVLS